MADLDPQARKQLEIVSQMPDISGMEPQAVRELIAQFPAPQVELEPLASVEDRMIAVGRESEIRIRVYTPAGDAVLPLFVYYHGGGWVLGSIEATDATCRMIANRTGHIVVSVDYRLAPEHKFPIPVEDAYAALIWVHRHAASLGGDPSRIVVSGDSAGGNLAAAASLLARDRGGPTLLAQVLIYPVTSLGYDTGSYAEFEKGFGLDRERMIWFGNHYIRDEADKRNPYVAPLTAADLRQLPFAYVVTAEYDVLRDEGLAYAEKLKEAGVPVVYTCEQGLIHGYFTNMLLFRERIESTIGQIGVFLETTVSSPDVQGETIE